MADLGDIGIALKLPDRVGPVPNSVSASVNSGSISHTVEVGAGGGYDRRRVLLLNPHGTVLDGTDTDPDTGSFTFHNVPPGQYEVLVMGQGTFRSQVFGPITVT